MKRNWWGYLTFPIWPILNYILSRCEKRFIKIVESNGTRQLSDKDTKTFCHCMLLACVCVFLMGER